jgi:hypothetical protein
LLIDSRPLHGTAFDLHTLRLSLLLALLCGDAFAQRPAVTPTRLSPGTKVDIDGLLNESFWKDSARLGGLTVTEPVEGTQPTHPSVISLAYDQDFFYVGLHCKDDPDEVRAVQMDRDANVRYDDVVEFWIDTFDDQRFGFWFQITAGGSRGDALLSDSGSSFNKNWDGIWYGRSRVTDDGWMAEVAIPFKTLAFESGQEEWGFNLRRKRVANGENSRWASPFVGYSFFKLSEGGVLRGMKGMRQGIGLDVVPYAKLGTTQDFEAGGDRDTDPDAGLDLAWRPTPSTTLLVTTNTDFAETEVDDQQVNLTRFPLFFPEKRDFFLQDAGVFEFGPSAGGPGRGRGRGDGIRPFFSRTIGRDPKGAAIPVLAGVKFTGRVGDWNIGMLETQVDSYNYLDDIDDDDIDESVGVDSQTLGVVRMSRNLGGENSVGMIATHGRPDGDAGAATYGADFRVGSSRLFGDGGAGSLWGFYVRSDNDAQSDEDDDEAGAAYGLQAETRTSSLSSTMKAFVTEEEYSPQLGFVRRTGVQHYSYQIDYTLRGGNGDAFREVEWGISPSYDRDLAGNEDLWRIPVQWLDLEFHSEDSISIESTHARETIDDRFELREGIDVTPGVYRTLRHTMRLRGSRRRTLTGDVRIEAGDFYSGDILRTRISPTLIPNKHVTLRAGYEWIDVELEEGSFDTQVASAELNLSFDPDTSWSNVVQYDTQNEDLALQTRLHWILEPGQNLFLVALLGWDRTDRDQFARSAEELVVKLSYTFRF